MKCKYCHLQFVAFSFYRKFKGLTRPVSAEVENRNLPRDVMLENLCASISANICLSYFANLCCDANWRNQSLYDMNRYAVTWLVYHVDFNLFWPTAVRLVARVVCLYVCLHYYVAKRLN